MREVPVPRFQLVEQPHVLDGDDRLISEGLEQSDLRIGKWPGFQPADGDGANRIALAHQRNAEGAAKAAGERRRLDSVVVIFKNVRDHDHTASQDGPGDGTFAAHGPWKLAAERFGALGADVRHRRHSDQLTIESGNRS